MSLADAIASARLSVVKIETARSQGTGFCIVSDSVFVTNAHVVQGARVARLSMEDGETLVAPVVWRDDRQDLAVIHMETGCCTPLRPAELGNLRVGHDVFTLGHPLGLSFSVTRGIISSMDRVVDGQTYLQTDASINPGNSGGPLLSTEGEVVGMNTFIYQGGTSLGFAIPIDRILIAVQRGSEGSNERPEPKCATCGSAMALSEAYCPTCGESAQFGGIHPSEGAVWRERVSLQTACEACGSQAVSGSAYCQVCGARIGG